MIVKKIKWVFIILIFVSVVATTSTTSIDIKNTNISKKLNDFKPYYFIVFGDTRNSPDGDNTGLETIAPLIENLMDEYDISFLLHDGDMVDSGGTQKEYDDYWWPEMEAILDTGIPLYVAPGNHEYSRTSGGDDIELDTWRSNVVNPNTSDYDEIYFSFNSPQNDTHFIVLNTEYYWKDVNTTRQQEQMDWLMSDFESNTIDRIVVMFHRPMWGVNPARVEEYELLREQWHDILVTNGVDLVINGHDHHFYHTVRNGTNFMISGGGTVALTKPIPTHPEIAKTWLDTDYAFADYFVSLVEATEESLNVDIITPNGSVVYEFSVNESVRDIYPPTIDSPEDIQMTENTTGNTITWTVSDAYPGTYTIYVDGTSVEQNSWTSGTITFNVDNLSEGTHNVTIVVVDANSNTIKDSVVVQVIAASTTTTQSTTTTIQGKTEGFEIFILLVSIISIVGFIRRKNK